MYKLQANRHTVSFLLQKCSAEVKFSLPGRWCVTVERAWVGSQRLNKGWIPSSSPCHPVLEYAFWTEFSCSGRTEKHSSPILPILLPSCPEYVPCATTGVQGTIQSCPLMRDKYTAVRWGSGCSHRKVGWLRPGNGCLLLESECSTVLVW